MPADVVFLVGMKRQYANTKYQGLVTKPKLLGILFTHGRRRVYPLMHDLTDGIELHPCGRGYERGIQLGASLQSIAFNARNSNVRHQLFYMELKSMAFRIWNNEFGVSKQRLSKINAGSDPTTSMNFENTLPFILSDTFKSLLIQRSPMHAQSNAGVALFNADFWRVQVNGASESFTSMECWWPAT